MNEPRWKRAREGAQRPSRRPPAESADQTLCIGRATASCAVFMPPTDTAADYLGLLGGGRGSAAEIDCRSDRRLFAAYDPGLMSSKVKPIPA